jgi:SAM-dependent methyltransferase
LLDSAGALERCGGLLASRVRVSTLGDALYLHSSFPTSEADAVFFGPDTYRFAAFIDNVLAQAPMTTAGRIVDVGCGTGAGGIVALRAAPTECALTLADISAKALRFARINAVLNGVAATFRQCDLFSAVEGDVDLIVANPPYLVDAKRRLYRNGGGALGGDLSLRIAREGVTRLALGGSLLLYTGSCIVKGEDLLCARIEACVREACSRGLGLSLSYQEIDPDVFGEELALPGYETVDRIAAVGAVIRRERAPPRRRGGAAIRV